MRRGKNTEVRFMNPGQGATKSLATLAVAMVLASALIGAAQPSWAQDPWSWPEKPQNLKTFPSDFTGKQLRGVMMGFTRALGVDCAHCHVGQSGQPLSTFDFASDENPKKEVARVMIGMLRDIGTTLKEIEPSGTTRVNMWCHTCHRGRPRPMTLAEELVEANAQGSIDTTIAYYRKLRAEFYGRGAFDFGEVSLNSFGYNLLRAGKVEDAIAIFRLNLELFPESGNVYDSLGEAYMTAGHNDLAIASYEKSLQRDPENANARDKLQQLRKQ